MRSVILFLIAIILFIVAYKVNTDLNEREAIDMRMHNAAGQFAIDIGGRFQEKPFIKQERMPVYLLCGLGGVAALAGVVTLGINKR